MLEWGHTSRTPWEATDPRVGSTDLKVRHYQLLKVGTELSNLYCNILSLRNCFSLSPLHVWVIQTSVLLMKWKELCFVRTEADETNVLLVVLLNVGSFFLV